MTPWTILIAPPQREFIVRDALIDLGIRTLVPVEFRTIKRDRARRRPVLPGYVFAEITRWDGLRHPGLEGARKLEIAGRPATLPQPAVNALEALSSPLSAIRSAPRLKPGQRIAYKVNAITTLQAEVARLLAGGKLVALVDLMGKRHAVTIDERDVEAA